MQKRCSELHDDVMLLRSGSTPGAAAPPLDAAPNARGGDARRRLPPRRGAPASARKRACLRISVEDRETADSAEQADETTPASPQQARDATRIAYQAPRRVASSALSEPDSHHVSSGDGSGVASSSTSTGPADRLLHGRARRTRASLHRFRARRDDDCPRAPRCGRRLSLACKPSQAHRSPPESSLILPSVPPSLLMLHAVSRPMLQISGERDTHPSAPRASTRACTAPTFPSGGSGAGSVSRGRISSRPSWWHRSIFDTTRHCLMFPGVDSSGDGPTAVSERSAGSELL